MHEAKTQLSRLVRRAQAGDYIVIANRGRPVARLVAIKSKAGKKLRRRVFGQDVGKKFWIAPDFDETPKEFEPYIK